MSVTNQIATLPIRPVAGRISLPRKAGVGFVILAPIAAFLAIRHLPGADPVLGTLSLHFFVVSAVAFLTLVLAIAVAFAARRLPDPRTFFLAGGFMVTAMIFFAHGLGTSPWFAQSSPTGGDPFAAYAKAGSKMPNPIPGVPTGSTGHDSSSMAGMPDMPGMDHTTEPKTGLDALIDSLPKTPAPAKGGHAGHDPGPGASKVVVARARLVGFSSLLSLAAGAPLFALSVIQIKDSIGNRIAKYWTPLFSILLVLSTAYVLPAIFFPTLLSWIPTHSQAIVYAVAIFACSCFGFAAVRNFQAYRMAMLPLQGTNAFAMVMLLESVIFLIFSPVGHLSWWEYHGVMLAGFCASVVALLLQFRATGDLGVVVEGLFLRDQITGIRKEDPKAMHALVAAVSAKDNETGNHIERVSKLSVAIGSTLGLSEERLLMLRWAGRLHDVGKIGVPNSILRKPGKLTDAEYEEMKLHPVRSYEVAMRSGALKDIAHIIRAHHERLDGKGYPDGLKGTDIPLEARIVATADFWDALTGPRPYRGPMPRMDAADLALKAAGTHLDPSCVEALFAIVFNGNEDDFEKERNGLWLPKTA